MVAGCTDFSLEITQRLKQFTQIISISNIRELDYIEQRDGQWCIGAGCSIATLLDTLGPMNSDIEDLLYRYGSTQVRNKATVGGNIGNASPIGDLPPLFIALKADVVLQSAQAERVIPLESFFIDYKKTALQADEIVCEIRFNSSALDSGNTVLKVYKISKRIDDDISSVCAVFYCPDSKAKSILLTAAFGGMAAIPKRAQALENAVANNPEDFQLIAQALEKDFQPISDARASAEYRVSMANNLYRKFLLELKQPEATHRLHNLGVEHA